MLRRKGEESLTGMQALLPILRLAELNTSVLYVCGQSGLLSVTTQLLTLTGNTDIVFLPLGFQAMAETIELIYRSSFLSFKNCTVCCGTKSTLSRNIFGCTNM